MRVQTMNKKFWDYNRELRKMQKEFELKLDDFLYGKYGVRADVTVNSKNVWVEHPEPIDIPLLEDEFLLRFYKMTVDYDKDGCAVKYMYSFTHSKPM